MGHLLATASASGKSSLASSERVAWLEKALLPELYFRFGRRFGRAAVRAGGAPLARPSFLGPGLLPRAGWGLWVPDCAQLVP